MNICVFCASASQIDESYFNEALKLGKEIARHSWGLVYGGTTCGLMREVADATLLNGGKVIGIIPECIHDKGIAASNLDQLIIASDMQQRKRMMREHADAFVAMAGGWGTLEEITEVITLKQLGFHNKPIVFLNTNGFYNRFFEFMTFIQEGGFVASIYTHLYLVANSVEEAIDYITHYKPEKIVSKY